MNYPLNGPTTSLDHTVVDAMRTLFVAGQASQDAHLPSFLTTNSVQVSIEPSHQVVSVAYQETRFQMTEAQAYQLASMMNAAADALREITLGRAVSSLTGKSKSEPALLRG
jgi:hypothetical protein